MTAPTARLWQFPADPATVHARVGADLASGQGLTTNEMLLKYGHSRGSDSVLKLRRLGWPIQTERIEVPTSDGERRARIARYSIALADIDACGEPLKQFVSAVRRAQGGTVR